MIERKFVASKIKEYQIQEFISSTVKNVGHSHTKMIRTPLGEKIVIYASRPGLVVGRKGENIKKLTQVLKKKFGLENPQIEISEVEEPRLNAKIVAERIASTLERFGLQRFKATGHRTLFDTMNAGAHGVEIILAGKIPSSRAKRWRFAKGYMKKCGDIAMHGVLKAQAYAQVKTGTVGVEVSILPPSVKLPDKIEIKKPEVQTEDKAEEKAKENTKTTEKTESNKKAEEKTENTKTKE